MKAVAIGVLALVAAAAALVVGLARTGEEGEQRPARAAAREHASTPPPARAPGMRFESAQLNEGPLPLRRVSFPTVAERATGLLGVPPGRRDPMPAVVYLHGWTADSTDFATEAVFMAAKGVVVLSIDSADVGLAPPRGDALAAVSEDLRRRRLTAERVRAAVAALAARPDVDPKRIAFVGFSRGAAVGALAAARIPRLAAEVYVSGAAGRATWPDAHRRLAPADRAAVQRLVSAADPARALRRAPRRPRLVQLGTRDEVVPQAALRAFAAAVPAPKRLTVRPRRHALDVPELYERLEWLDRELAVEGPPVRGAPYLTRRAER